MKNNLMFSKLSNRLKLVFSMTIHLIKYIQIIKIGIPPHWWYPTIQFIIPETHVWSNPRQDCHSLSTRGNWSSSFGIWLHLQSHPNSRRSLCHQAHLEQSPFNYPESRVSYISLNRLKVREYQYFNPETNGFHIKETLATLSQA